MPGIDLFAGAQETALFGFSVRNIAPPAPTTGPNLYPNALGIRQEATGGDSSTFVTSETCAWFSHTGMCSSRSYAEVQLEAHLR